MDDEKKTTPFDDPLDDELHPDPDPGLGESERERFHRLFSEKLMPEILRRGLESGMDTFLRSDRGVRKAITDLKLRRELTNYFFHQIDQTKNAALRVIAGEVRDFLENTNLEQSLFSVLTSLAFEIRTEVRFVPTEDGPLRPSVESRVSPSGRSGGKKKTTTKKKAKKKAAAKKSPPKGASRKKAPSGSTSRKPRDED
jgi:hypothetical protein